jgi:hypothetical protein
MAETQSNAGHANEGGSDDRFRYIGFGVYPKHVPRFWKSDAEQQEFAHRIKVGVGGSTLERDFSLITQEAMTRIDRVVITVAGILLVLTAVLPWVQFATRGGGQVSLLWPSALGALLGGLGTAFGGGLGVGLSALLGLVMLLGSPILGIWLLVSCWTKAKSPEAYLVRLRRPLNLGYVLFFAGFGIMVLALLGGQIPGIESWGLKGTDEGYGIGTLVGIASFGFYVAMAMGLVAGVKSGDL